MQENPGIIFIAMNYSVHAVMYTYYWLAIIKKVRPPVLSSQSSSGHRPSHSSLLTPHSSSLTNFHPPPQVPEWFPTWLITLAQILQMVVGVFVAYNYYRVLSAGGSCAVSTDLLWACAVMYSTYLYLFVEFAVKRCVAHRLDVVALSRLTRSLVAGGGWRCGVCLSSGSRSHPSNTAHRAQVHHQAHLGRAEQEQGPGQEDQLGERGEGPTQGCRLLVGAGDEEVRVT